MNKLWTRWVAANTCGFTIGFIVHALIAHGITGHHEKTLSLAQTVTHSLGFFSAGALIALAQRNVLGRFAEIGAKQIVTAGTAASAGYMIGFFLFGIPLDWLFGMAAIGVMSGLALRSSIPNAGRWIAAASIGFAVTSGVQVLAALPVYKILLNVAEKGSILNELALWGYLSLVGGLAGGLITAPFLVKVLNAEDRYDEPALTADALSQSAAR